MVFVVLLLYLKPKIIYMDSKELLNLIRFVAKAGVSEVKYKTKDLKST